MARRNAMRALRAHHVCVFVAAVALSVTLAFVDREFFGAETLVAAVVGAAILAPVFLRVWQGRFDLFEPLNLVAGIYFLYFVFAPVYRLTTGDVAQWGRTFTELYVPAFVAVFVAVLSMWLGYALPVGR